MILFLTRKYPPMIGGMERLSYRLTQEIARQRPARIISWGGSQRWLPLAAPTLAIRALTPALSASKRALVSIVHVGDPMLAHVGLMVGATYGVPVVCTAHGLDVTWPFRPYQQLVPPALRRLDHVVAISESTARECAARGVDPARLSVIPVGVDLPANLPDRPTARRLLKENGIQIDGWPVILTVGRLVRRKGVRWFLDSAYAQVLERLPRAHYVITSDGPERAAIDEIVRTRFAGRVSVLGRVSDEVKDLLFRAADCFLMPNLAVTGDMEGFGIVAVEAAAYRLPVVAAAIEGIQDSVVPGVTGRIVTPGDRDGFVESLCDILRQPAERESLGLAARRHVAERLAWRTIADQYLTVFDRVIAGQDRNHRKL